MADETTLPQWGYKADGSAKIFDLKAGESLPKGWSADPTVIKDERKRTANYLSGIRPEGDIETPAEDAPAEEPALVEDVKAEAPAPKAPRRAPSNG